MQGYFEYSILGVVALHCWLCPLVPGLKRSQMAIYAGVRLFYKGLRSINFFHHVLDNSPVADHQLVSMLGEHQAPCRLIPVVGEVHRMYQG